MPEGSSSAALTGILLAAGAGSRFGGRKLLQPLPDGTPVGVASLRNLSAALGPVVAVVRPGDDELQRLLVAEGAHVVVCEDAMLGMGHSLATAVGATADAAGWVVALGDMPSLRPATITAVAQTVARTGAIVVPMYGGERGHPVGFPAGVREELLLLKGDEGARALLRRQQAGIIKIEIDDPGTLRDVDTPADLQALGASLRGG